MKGLVFLIDPVECHNEKDYQRINISTNYSGTSIGIRDPLGLEYISSYLKTNGINTRIIVKNNHSDEDILNKISKERPYIVAFSVWSYMFKKVVSLSEKIKARFPEIYIVLGGYHPSFNPDVVKHWPIDFASIGEGEETMVELARVLREEYTEEDLNSIKGISYFNSKGQVIVTPQRPRLNFSRLPFPDRPEEIVNLSKITGLTNPSAGSQVSPLQISYSRGCPQDCDFCPSSKLWQKKVEYRNVDDVIDEILYLQQKYNTNYIYFSDLTFNLNPQKVYDLCHRIIERKVRISWSAMVKVDENIEKNKEIFKIMKESGCSRLAFGVEGFDDNNKLKEWTSVEAVKKNIMYVDSLGIITRAFLLMGFPFESKKYYVNMINYLKELPIDNIRLAFVVPFSGTALHAKYKHELDGDLSKYTGEYPLLNTEHMTKEELIEKRKEIVREFYNSDEYIHRVINKVNKHPGLHDSFKYFFSQNLYNEGILKESTLKMFLDGVKNEKYCYD